MIEGINSTESEKSFSGLSKQIEAQEESQKSLYTATELLAMDIKEVPKLWNPFFPTRGVVGLTGSSDSSKSLFLRQFAMAVAANQKEYLGYELNLKHGRAIYVSTEDDYEGTAALLNKHIPVETRNLYDNLIFEFDSRNILAKLDTLLTESSSDVVILDVWSDMFTGNSNNWVDIRQNLSLIKELATKHDCLIVVLHHTIKHSEKAAPDKGRLNGSQAIEAKLRCLLELRNAETPNERIMYVLKNNYMSNEDKMIGHVLSVDSTTLLLSNTTKTIAKPGSAGDAQSKTYDIAKWVPLMKNMRKEGLSFKRAWKQLRERFPEEDLPGLTWFKENDKKIPEQPTSSEPPRGMFDGLSQDYGQTLNNLDGRLNH